MKIAGRVAVFLSLAFVVLLGGLAFAQEVQTDSLTLDDLIAIIYANEALGDDQKTVLDNGFTSVVEEGYLSVEEALALLDVAGAESWTTETPAEDVAFVVEALELVLTALHNGRIDPEGALQSLADVMASGSLNDLKDALAEWVTPEGISNVIGREAFAAGLEGDALKDLLDRANLLIADGVPPGIVVRIIKDKLRTAAESEDGDLATEALTTLNDLYSAVVDEGLPPGQAANKIQGKGKYKAQDDEQTTGKGEKGKGKGHEK
jgi:hypothetical protein